MPGEVKLSVATKSVKVPGEPPPVSPTLKTLPEESFEYKVLFVRSTASSPLTKSPATGAPEPFFVIIVVAIKVS